MTPYDKMEAWYAAHPGPLPFRECVDMYQADGVVEIDWQFFVMGRPVSTNMPEWAINETMAVSLRPNAWYIFAMAGDLRKVWDALPYPLPLVCFNRHGQKNLRFYSLPRMSDLCGKLVPQ